VRSIHEHDFSAGVTAFAQFVRGRDLGERERRRDRHPQPVLADFVLEDVSLALMANEGIRAESPEMRAAASRRFAALMIQSFQAEPVPATLPPAVRLPLSRG
jgi:hypothetical protein